MLFVPLQRARGQTWKNQLVLCHCGFAARLFIGVSTHSPTDVLDDWLIPVAHLEQSVTSAGVWAHEFRKFVVLWCLYSIQKTPSKCYSKNRRYVVLVMFNVHHNTCGHWTLLSVQVPGGMPAGSQRRNTLSQLGRLLHHFPTGHQEKQHRGELTHTHTTHIQHKGQTY